MTAARWASTAQTWLSEMNGALDAKDSERLTSLVTPEFEWRDLLAYTWTLKTTYGRDEAVEHLVEHQREAQSAAFELDHTIPPRLVCRLGAEVLEFLYSFTTAGGTGRGVVRLVDHGDGRWRAVSLLTTLQTLDDFPERRGAHRPRGESARNFGGPNWLDERRLTVEFLESDPPVLIVGAGQAGLITAARLKMLGIESLVIDALPRVGDNWRNRYHALTLHNEVWVNHMPYLPFPDAWPTYVPKDKLANWFEFYVDALELNVWTSTRLLTAHFDETCHRWEVRLSRPDGGTRTLRPRHVVMATGVSGIPHIPDLPGIEDFGGATVHSSAYGNGAAFADGAAIVVGTGNSAHDVAQDLHAHGVHVTMVQRSPTTVISLEPSSNLTYRIFRDHPSTEAIDLINLASMSYESMKRSCRQLTQEMSELDRELVASLNARGFRTDEGEDGTGYLMKYLRKGGGYYIDVGCSRLIADGQIDVIQYSDVERFDNLGLVMRDGSRIPADVTVFGTGYRPIQESVAEMFGEAVAQRVGPVWGIGPDGELNNMFRPTAQDGLWFMGGSLSYCRMFSHFLALQIRKSLKSEQDNLASATLEAGKLLAPSR